ncbi:hypothetical protein OG875_10410 [Streptomyces sp. NBC_01498]|uniref:hypothetical protein n=1 Tax=Streptomyces sp. NBC_01498 TaxID=2975870 RepID=UPI002E7B7798|nr:hypothetical protein [Streptomyces sp. NBC_01498]WTL24975.1 hypothetical protein OG875_10410 [Streptomyces sp. NBC_01498]
MRSRTSSGRSLAVLAGALALAGTAGGCGIRTTAVPVNAGPAPSRVPCEVAGGNLTTQGGPGLAVRVYLVCGSKLVPVERAASLPTEKATGERVRMAQALVNELRERTSATEQEAGFTTYVRGPLHVSEARDGDPAGTLRLSRQPEDLQTAALAQIVCTLTEAAWTDGSVVLGGPGAYGARGYRCDDDTKRHPDAPVPTTGPRAPAS